ncbi:MAG: metal ABC transporter ATP-binding protein [Bacteroidetes bacterium]|nr:metal ABC transporter ATP-binding protein [Bacteroidota bacterium]
MIKLSSDPSIEIHDMTVSYNRKPVLWGVDISLPKNQIISIVGPNGAGKSTLLKSIMGLIEIDSGYIKIFDKSLNEIRHKVSYVPQRESVDWDFPASVYDIVMMGRYQYMGLFRRASKKDKEIVLDSMEKLSIASLKNRQISQLSGGQQQRVFLARALAQQADIYFMDEPFSAIDISTENAIIELFKEMVKLNKTIIVVHHDIYSVKNYFDWTVMLNMRIIASGPTNQVLNAENFKETYGSHLNILTEVSNIVKKERIPIREKKLYKKKK